MPYLPVSDLNNVHFKNRNFNSSCAWYPTFLDIKIHNDYWQEFIHDNITIYIFGSYLDKRSSIIYDEPVVRVLVMMNFLGDRVQDYPELYCQVWYDQQPKPFISRILEVRPIWQYIWGHNFKYHFAHFLSCSLPEEHRSRIPRSVSLVSKPCDKATNNVLVTYDPLKENENKKKFLVCVKGLDFPYVDMSHRLVEFIETLRSLGADKIVMYKLQVHPNTTKVLEYYVETGYLEYRPFSLTNKVSNLPGYRHLEINKNSYSYMLHEVVPYNDCIYRHMYQYEYAAVIDIDEILMPLGNNSNWHDLVKLGEMKNDQKCKNYASFCFLCIYFPHFADKPRYSQEFPDYFYMLQHVYRVKDHLNPEFATKCFHNTERVIAAHNHFPIHTKWDVCANYSFNNTEAQLQHYREPKDKNTLNVTVVDKSLWRFKDEIIERSMKVFDELSFFKEVSLEIFYSIKLCYLLVLLFFTDCC